MWKIFKRKQEPVSKWASYFNFIDRRKQKAADYLQQQTSGIKPGILKLWLYLFIGLTTCLLFVNLYLGLYKPGKIQVTPISIPQQYKVEPDVPVPLEVIERIKRTYRFIDSLKKSGNSELYNKLKRDRPGLLDSLNIMYKNNQNEK